MIFIHTHTIRSKIYDIMFRSISNLIIFQNFCFINGILLIYRKALLDHLGNDLNWQNHTYDSNSTLPVKHIIWQIVLICSNFHPTNFDTFACGNIMRNFSCDSINQRIVFWRQIRVEHRCFFIIQWLNLKLPVRRPYNELSVPSTWYSITLLDEPQRSKYILNTYMIFISCFHSFLKMKPSKNLYMK